EVRNLRSDLPHALFVRKDGFATTIRDLEGHEAADATIVLARMSTLSGRIVDAKGEGIGGASIQLTTPRPGAQADVEALAIVSASTDAEGRFRLVDLHAGTQRLRIWKP